MSSVDVDWFIRPYWGKLELDATSLKDYLTQDQKGCWKYISEILKIVRTCAQ